MVLLEGGADELGPRLAELWLAEELVGHDEVPIWRRIVPAVVRAPPRGLLNEINLVVGATGDALDKLSLADGAKHAVILLRLGARSSPARPGLARG